MSGREFMDCRECHKLGRHTRTHGCILALEPIPLEPPGPHSHPMPLEPPLEPRDRLSRVEARSTFVLLLYVRGMDPDEDAPAHILGPYTRVECERMEQNLACEYRREQINTQVPTWADARIGRG